ncbi:MAG: hypothetical protein D6718_03850 [Acidobacteria bacterium]|nr:MAG: hypothetical protein D6718_03850 [Acidobacteriota bacterium]
MNGGRDNLFSLAALCVSAALALGPGPAEGSATTGPASGGPVGVVHVEAAGPLGSRGALPSPSEDVLAARPAPAVAPGASPPAERISRAAPGPPLTPVDGGAPVSPGPRAHGTASPDGDALPDPGLPGGPLTLERAIALAEERNPQLAAASARAEAGEAMVRAARAERRPRVNLEETVSRTTNPTLVFSNLLGQEAFGPENFAIDALNRPDALDNFATRLSVEQPLWTGGRIAHGLAAARAEGEARRAEREAVRQRIVSGVIEAYAGALLARARVAVAEKSLATVRQQVEMVRNHFEAGLVVESDLLQVQVHESEVMEELIRARSDAEVALAALDLAIGLPLETDLELPETLEMGTDEGEPDIAALTAEALAQRPDLAAARHRLEAGRRSVALARAARWPEIGLAGMVEANDPDFIGTSGTNWSVMLNARWTIGDFGRTTARVRARRRELEAAQQDVLQFERSVALEVRRAVSELRAARARVEQARRAVKLAESSLRIVTDRYREGLTTLVELMKAETALTAARMREVAARRDVLVARARVDLAAGRL